MTRKSKGKSNSAKSNNNNANSKSEVINTRQKRSRLEDPDKNHGSRKMPKRAAACLDFRERPLYIADKSSTVDLKRKSKAQNEGHAIALTSGKDDPRPNRKLTNFTFHDLNGKMQQVEKLQAVNIFVSGIILPLEGPLDEENDKGVTCEGFARIESWAISGYEEGFPVIYISTNVVDYECLEPAKDYRNLYNLFFEKAVASIEVYKKLSKTYGGKPDLMLEELLSSARKSSVSHSLTTGKKIPCDKSVKEFVISQGDFIYNQLIGLDETSKDQVFKDLPVLVALKDESKKNGRLVFRKRNSLCLEDKSAVIDVKGKAVNEGHAAVLTSGPDDPRPNRRLTNFAFHDINGNLQPVEMMEVGNLYISGTILHLEESFDKKKDKGIPCEGFGRLESWAIAGYEEGRPIILVSTNICDYECINPANKYANHYNLFFEKARATVEVHKRLARTCGGNPDITLDELLALVVRSLSVSKNFPHRTSIKDFVISQGDFIYNQLIGLDESRKQNDQVFTDLPLLISLKDERKKHIGKQKKVDQSSSPSCETTIDGEENVQLASLLREEENTWSMKPTKRKSSVISSNRFCVQDEIASDYPLPAYYKVTDTEADEFVIFSNDFDTSDPDELPRCMLHSWSLYDSDFQFTSLELLPMKPCADADVGIYGSGRMSKDDGNWVSLNEDENQSSSSSSRLQGSDGTLIYLSAVKEWMVEVVSSRISVSIRTDVAWYRLGKPSKQYAPWLEPVLKTARLAISIIGLLKQQTRASRLSFDDIVKWVSELGKNNPFYISRSAEVAERYLIVHGPIILHQFSEYPDEAIRKCAFITGLGSKMEQWHHTKWLLKKKAAVRIEKNLNPQSMMVPANKPMPATVTPLVNRIWGENSDDDIYWIGEVRGKSSSGEPIYRQAIVRGNVVTVGGCVLLETGSSNESPSIYFVEYMFESLDRRKIIHGRLMLRGSETVLLNDANAREVFLTNECLDFELEKVKQPVVVELRYRPWGYQYRKENAQKDKIGNERARENKSKGLPMEYYCKSLYSPEKGAFFCLATDKMGMGSGVCHSCNVKESQKEKEAFKLNSAEVSFTFMGAEYRINDFLYVAPQYVPVDSQVSETLKNKKDPGLKTFVVCQLLEIETPKASRKPCHVSTNVKVSRFFRPEDVSTENAYCSHIQEVYYSDQTFVIPVAAIKGKCAIRKKNDIPSRDGPMILEHIFFCENLYDPDNRTIKQLPAHIKFNYSKEAAVDHVGNGKEKGKGREEETFSDVNKEKMHNSHENLLATLDIFSGCGGLSEGLEQAGVSLTKWAIEYEQTAAKAFSLNHPESLMFVNNCNVILRAIMAACGDQDECISTLEAVELAKILDEKEIRRLPRPGEVDFINGGPPCQGFSQLNRFKQGDRSKVQRQMILAILSFAEYFRPKFFLLENVRNFITFNKGKTFRLTLATLLEMGYQVRFGVLEAGAYGIPQTRKRAFIWAASPEEILPEWPEPMHVFAGSDLKISLSGSSSYVAVPSTANGAPFRSMTVRDSIGDLPTVLNGASATTIEYQNEPVSWYQEKSRKNSLQLTDHISKEMCELRLIRCQKIPKRPGADWRDLPDKKLFTVSEHTKLNPRQCPFLFDFYIFRALNPLFDHVKLATGNTVKMIPKWMSNKAETNNQWKGMYGRLDWEGNFPTAVTNPQPAGKVGKCFHPDQDRIITVRECARSQGFSDAYKFCGNIQHKHRQIGNAVPPPLAYALGRKLKEASRQKQLNSTIPKP